MESEWRREWKENGMANHTKTFYDGPNKHKARHVYKLARLELGRFVRIVTDHNNLNFFQTKIGLWRNASCRYCGEHDETITHFLSACPRFFSAVTEIMASDLPRPDMKWSVRKLLDFSYVPAINEAYEGQRRCRLGRGSCMGPGRLFIRLG